MFGQNRKVSAFASRFALGFAVIGGSMLGAKAQLAGEAGVEIGIQVARDLMAKKFAPVGARMSGEMAANLSETRLAGIWDTLTKQLGPCESMGEAWSEAKTGFTIVRVPLKFGAQTLDLKISVASDRVVGFFIVSHEEPISAWRPPAYANPDTFRDIEVKIGAGPDALPATLSLPKGVTAAPVVILVHGSGPQDRDESLGPNRVFRDLATGLASRGIAVLRYEKRTKAYPESFARLKDLTIKEEALDDVTLAIELLKARADIDLRRIALIGHSLGGTIAPRIAAQNVAVSKIVILAGSARPLPDIIVEQTEYLAGLKGPINDETAKTIRELKAEAARTRAARPGDEGAPFLGVPLSYWADLNTYDSAAVAAGLTIPILVLQGGRDYQVTAEDFGRFGSALTGHDNAALHLLPGLNHLFMSGNGRSTPAEYENPGHVDVDVINLIAAFVLAKE